MLVWSQGSRLFSQDERKILIRISVIKEMPAFCARAMLGIA
jgi:hypothetical protein